MCLLFVVADVLYRVGCLLHFWFCQTSSVPFSSCRKCVCTNVPVSVSVLLPLFLNLESESVYLSPGVCPGPGL
jgi:hypothetical protein